jgi:hypothetical protein
MCSEPTMSSGALICCECPAAIGPGAVAPAWPSYAPVRVSDSRLAKDPVLDYFGSKIIQKPFIQKP